MKIFSLALFISSIFACSPAPGWKPKSPGELTELADFVIGATTFKLHEYKQQGPYSATLEVLCSFKQPLENQDLVFTTIKVDGFKPSSLCGTSTAVNTSQILFLKRKEGSTFELVENDLHGGSVALTMPNVEEVLSRCMWQNFKRFGDNLKCLPEYYYKSNSS
jgi:hypothetical protein